MTEYFFIAGAQRSGTSYCYALLAEHPEIEMAKPLRPEPKFFHTDALFERGLDYYTSNFFENKHSAWLRGEKSTSYIESEKAAKRIACCFPKAKILFVLRDPIERAISNYWFTVNSGLETLSISEAFLHEEERWANYDPERFSVSPYAYLRRGRYIDFISTYERYFPWVNIKIILYEQLVGSQETLQAIYTFLEVTSDFTPVSLDTVINKEERLDASVSPNLLQYLTDYFAESKARLEEQFGLDLTIWNKYEST